MLPPTLYGFNLIPRHKAPDTDTCSRCIFVLHSERSKHSLSYTCHPFVRYWVGWVCVATAPVPGWKMEAILVEPQLTFPLMALLLSCSQCEMNECLHWEEPDSFMVYTETKTKQTAQHTEWHFARRSVVVHIFLCPCVHLHIGTKCRCVGTVPPQALLAEEIEGVLCTAGMKAGWRSNRSLFRLGTLRSTQVERERTVQRWRETKHRGMREKKQMSESINI